MTVNSVNITSGLYTGTNLVSVYSYDFRVDDETEVEVYETDLTGVVTKLTVNTDFTVAGLHVDIGGLITRVAGNLPTGYTWYIRSNRVDTQLTAFASQGGFFPDVHEASMDKLTFIEQQNKDLLNRAIKLSEYDSSVSSTSLVIPSVADRANKILTFDSAGNLIVRVNAGVITDAEVKTLYENNANTNEFDDAEQAKLAAIPNPTALDFIRGNAGGTAYELRTAAQVKTDIGIGNVDNTSDANKPISTATQAALNLKVTKTSDTGSAVLPKGTTAQRDGTPAVGYQRWNTTTSGMEVWDGTAWSALGSFDPISAATIKSKAVAKPTVFQDSAGTEVMQGCTAWVNFDGDRGTIRASFNVVSVVRNSAGDYTITFATPMADTNYSTVLGDSLSYDASPSDDAFILSAGTLTTVHIGAGYYYPSQVLRDQIEVNVAIFGGK